MFHVKHYLELHCQDRADRKMCVSRETHQAPPYSQIEAQRSGFDLDKEEGADGYRAWGKSHKRNAVGSF